MKLRIPPALLFVMCAALGWVLSRQFAVLDIRWAYVSVLGWITVFFGAALLVISVKAFVRARTTVNPLDPAKADKLVTTGLYRISRNPMYLAMAIVLLGEALLLANFAAFAAPAIFVLAITRLQILPEESALRRIFGDQYRGYCQNTRRWI